MITARPSASTFSLVRWGASRISSPGRRVISSSPLIVIPPFSSLNSVTSHSGERGVENSTHPFSSSEAEKKPRDRARHRRESIDKRKRLLFLLFSSSPSFLRGPRSLWRAISLSSICYSIASIRSLVPLSVSTFLSVILIPFPYGHGKEEERGGVYSAILSRQLPFSVQIYFDREEAKCLL